MLSSTWLLHMVRIRSSPATAVLHRYKTMVISPRLGSAFDKKTYAPAQATNRSEWRFTIEDPFELSHDLGEKSCMISALVHPG